MNQEPRTKNQELPDDVVLSVRHVSKKFCRNLRRSMWYGVQDLTRNLLGLRPDAVAGLSGCQVVGAPDAFASGTPTTNNEQPRTRNQEQRPNNQQPATNSLPPLRKDEFWALEDVSVEFGRGEVVGIIGPNGSGKSTFFRLLAGIYPPDRGEIAIRGRVGALIALGAGFHPHMTGRENVYLNGTILGMSRPELDEKFDAIVDFAGVGTALDAPVSTYSSGMRVRLGFAIAAYMQPDILLIDEVLAVGDLAFRNKCYTYMSELPARGSTVMLVTHNMEAIRKWCRRCIVWDKGRIVYDGNPHEGVRRYELMGNEAGGGGPAGARLGSGEVRITGVRFQTGAGDTPEMFRPGDSVDVVADYEAAQPIDDPVFAFSLESPTGEMLVGATSRECGCAFGRVEGRGRVRVRLHDVRLKTGAYKFSMAVHRSHSQIAPYDVLYRMHVLKFRDEADTRGWCDVRLSWEHRPEAA